MYIRVSVCVCVGAQRTRCVCLCECALQHAHVHVCAAATHRAAPLAAAYGLIRGRDSFKALGGLCSALGAGGRMAVRVEAQRGLLVRRLDG